jgi:hypothetical protein
MSEVLKEVCEDEDKTLMNVKGDNFTYEDLYWSIINDMHALAKRSNTTFFPLIGSPTFWSQHVWPACFNGFKQHGEFYCDTIMSLIIKDDGEENEDADESGAQASDAPDTGSTDKKYDYDVYSSSQHVAKKAKPTISCETGYTNRLLVFVNFVKNWFVDKSIPELCMQIPAASFTKHYSFHNSTQVYIYDAEAVSTNIVDSMHYTITCYNIFCQQKNYFESTTKDKVLVDPVFADFLSNAEKMVKDYSTQVSKAMSCITDSIHDDEEEEEEGEEEEGEDEEEGEEDDDNYDPSNDPDKNEEDGDEEGEEGEEEDEGEEGEEGDEEDGEVVS